MLKFGPLWTVNHWPFLHEGQPRKSKPKELGPELLNGEFPLPKIGETLLTSRESAGGLYLTEIFLGRIFYQ